jgi:DNA topoisomerase IA
MGVSVLMVAEKPSLAASIAQFLSGGQVRCRGVL